MSLLSDLINLDLSDVTEKIIAEYIWVGGSGMDLRSKARTLPGPVTLPSELPKWSYDGSYRGYGGSCRGQAAVEGEHSDNSETGDSSDDSETEDSSDDSKNEDSDDSGETEDSEFILHPQAIFPDPFRGGSHILVMCDACNEDGDPIHTKKQGSGATILSDSDISDEEAGDDIEQKYTLLPKEVKLPLRSTEGGSDNPQAFGRDIVDAHYKACLYAGINISGIEGEVKPGKWGYKVGPTAEISPQSAWYQQCVAHYILERITETAGVFLIPGAMFDHYTNEILQGIKLAQKKARRHGHKLNGAELILSRLFDENDVQEELKRIINRGREFVGVDITSASRAKHVFEHTLEEARQLGHTYGESDRLLLEMLRIPEVATHVLKKLGADSDDDSDKIESPVDRELRELNEYGTNFSKLAEEGKLDPVVGRQEQIERVAQILGRRTKNNPCLIGEPGIGKTAIVEGLAQKIVNGDVPETIKGKKVFTLDVVGLVAGASSRGQFEERLKELLEEIKRRDDIILFVDEVHILIGAGSGSGQMDAANIMKPALARGELRCIGATTIREYRKYIEKDPALERRFQSVSVPEPTVEETIEILKGLQERYETHHMVRYSDEALVAAAQLSDRYISDRFLPDKAIDLVDEAGSRVRLRHAQLPEEARELEEELRQITKEKNEAVRNQDYKKAGELHDKEVDIKAKISALVDKSKDMDKAPQHSKIKAKISSLVNKSKDMDKAPRHSKIKAMIYPPVDKSKDVAKASVGGASIVTEADIQRIVFSWTGIPVEKLSADDSSRLLTMEETLHKRVIGQDEAVTAITRAIQVARVGLENPNRPIASFIFTGPTGVGKTEVAKALAACYFGSEKDMIRLDMSEFAERHTISKLIGSPPGYVGYNDSAQLTDAVRRRPYIVVLFDEIEKAHSDIFNVMLQILEDGRLTDSKGRTVNFKNTLIIMTSNLGSNLIERGSRRIESARDDKEKDDIYDQIKSSVTKHLKQHFKPEFINRLDEMIVFRQLTKPELKQIADIMLKEVIDRLKTKRKVEVQVTEKFRDIVVDEGYDSKYGARPLRRAIKRFLTDSMARKILGGEIKEGDSIIVDINYAGNVIFLNGSSGTPPKISLEQVVG